MREAYQRMWNERVGIQNEEDLHEDAVGNEDIHKSRTIQQSLFMDDKWE